MHDASTLNLSRSTSATTAVSRLANPSLKPSAPMDHLPPDNVQPAQRFPSAAGDQGQQKHDGGGDDDGGKESKTGRSNSDIASLVAALKVALQGDSGGAAEVHARGTPGFHIHATVFNGVIVSRAIMLVRPRTARQISRLVLFCTRRGLELSVKSGGYGTHGWSVAGEVVLDMSSIDGVKVDEPSDRLPMLREYVLPSSASSNSNKDKKRAAAAAVKEPQGGSSGSSSSNKGKERATVAGTSKRADSFAGACESIFGQAGSGGCGSGAKRLASDQEWAEDRSSSSSSGGSAVKRQQQQQQAPASADGPEPASAVRRPIMADRGRMSSTRADASPPPQLDEAQKRSMMDGLGALPTSSGYASGSGSSAGGGLAAASSSSSSSMFGPGGFYATANLTALPPSGFDALNPAFTASTPFSLATGFGLDSQRWQFGGQSCASPAASSSSSSSSSSAARGSRPSFSTHSSFDSAPGDPQSHPAHTVVTFGAGATTKQIDRITSASPWGPYHIPLAAFPVGSAIMMTGGFGFLSREYGLSMDNLLEIEMVLADGRIVWLGRDDEAGNGRLLGLDHPDGPKAAGTMTDDEARELWWAIRGAGIAMGIAVRYRAKAYYVPVVYSGNIIYPFNPLTAPGLLKHVRDCVKGSPRAMYANMILTAGPSSVSGVVIIEVCFTGVRAKGAELMEAISSWQGERSLFKDIEERSFLEQQDSIANVLKGGAGRKWFIKSDLLVSLTDEVVWRTCQQFGQAPDGCTWLFECAGGAIVDCKTTCLPQAAREASYTVAALHQWPNNVPEEDPRCITTAQNWVEGVIHPNSPGGPLPCFLQSSHPDAVRGVYGENFERLQQIKLWIDPNNFFRHSLWPSSVTDSSHKHSGFSLPVTLGKGERPDQLQQQLAAMEDSKIGSDGIQAVLQAASSFGSQSSSGTTLMDGGVAAKHREMQNERGEKKGDDDTDMDVRAEA